MDAHFDGLSTAPGGAALPVVVFVHGLTTAILSLIDEFPRSTVYGLLQRPSQAGAPTASPGLALGAQG